MVEISAVRQGPLDRLPGQQVASTAAALCIAQARAKFSLRCRADAAAAAGRAFGVPLPETACRAAVARDRAALWLGPDEWLLFAAPDDAEAIARQIAAGLAGMHHSLIDVSHRSCGFTVKGVHAATLMSHGCPLDLSSNAFPIGMCTRTLFEKSEIILWRVDEHTYHVEIERSFAPYVWTMFVEVRREFE